MTFLRCTCDLAGIQHSFEFLFVVSGLGVEVWLKRCLRAEKGQATRVSMFYPFIFPFFFQFSFLHYHMYHFFLIPSDLEVGSGKSIFTRTQIFSITIFFKGPLFFITLFLNRMCFYLLFISTIIIYMDKLLSSDWLR